MRLYDDNDTENIFYFRDFKSMRNKWDDKFGWVKKDEKIFVFKQFMVRISRTLYRNHQ